MTKYTDIGVEKHGHVGLIEIRKPPLNFFDVSLINQIADALEEFDKDIEIRASVLAAQGKAFCAGADFSDPKRQEQEAQSQRDPAMGRRSKLKRLEKVRKEKLLPVGINAERFEHPGLQIALMNSNAPASDLNAVQDNVVGLRTNLSELACFQAGDIFALGASERVMHSIPFLFLAAVG
jgi:hypothetical protein